MAAASASKRRASPPNDSTAVPTDPTDEAEVEAIADDEVCGSGICFCSVAQVLPRATERSSGYSRNLCSRSSRSPRLYIIIRAEHAIVLLSFEFQLRLIRACLCKPSEFIQTGSRKRGKNKHRRL
jgi:hypothetical protein